MNVRIRRDIRSLVRSPMPRPYLPITISNDADRQLFLLRPSRRCCICRRWRYRRDTATVVCCLFRQRANERRVVVYNNDTVLMFNVRRRI